MESKLCCPYSATEALVRTNPQKPYPYFLVGLTSEKELGVENLATHVCSRTCGLSNRIHFDRGIHGSPDAAIAAFSSAPPSQKYNLA